MDLVQDPVIRPDTIYSISDIVNGLNPELSVVRLLLTDFSTT